MSTSRMSTPKSSTRQLVMKNLPSPVAIGMRFNSTNMAMNPMFAMRQGTLDCALQKSLLPMTMNGKMSRRMSGTIKPGILKSNMC